MLEIIRSISLAFGHLARVLTVAVFFSLTTAIALLSLAFLISSPFEYSYGQDDIALADVLALALLGLACWRFFRRGTQSGASPWHLLKRFMFTLSYTTLVLVSIIAVAAFAAVVEPESAGDGLAGGVDDLFLYGTFSIFIVAIFGATPLPWLFKDPARADHSTSIDRNPVWGSSSDSAEPPTLEPITGSDSKESM